MAQHATQTSFKKGQIANPNGRPPKGYSITETMKAMLTERPEIKQALAAKVLEVAMKGDVTAAKLLWSYMDGMPMQKNETDVTSGGKPISSILSQVNGIQGNNSDQETTES